MQLKQKPYEQVLQGGEQSNLIFLYYTSFHTARRIQIND
jgi:hypothetical protein